MTETQTNLETCSTPESRYASKLALTRKLYEKGLDRDTFVNLYIFIDGVLTLPENLERRYIESIKVIEQECDMPYITSIEHLGRKEGLQEGLQLGLQQGRKEGMEQGRQEEARVIAQNLRAMDMDNAFIGKVTGLSDEDVTTLLKQTH